MAWNWQPWTRLKSRCSALAWTTAGRWSLRRGRLPEAVLAFERAVVARPEGFVALLRLAHGYLLTRDVWRAHRALAQAREVDPIRFARVAPAWLTRLGVGGELRHRLLGHPERTETPPRQAEAVPTARPPRTRVTAAQLPLGDCVDLAEYARFQAMPPISEGERESIDWDALLDDLLEP